MKVHVDVAEVLAKPGFEVVWRTPPPSRRYAVYTSPPARRGPARGGRFADRPPTVRTDRHGWWTVYWRRR